LLPCSRPSENRTIPLNVIAERTKLSVEDVEHLLIKSLSVSPTFSLNIDVGTWMRCINFVHLIRSISILFSGKLCSFHKETISDDIYIYGSPKGELLIPFSYMFIAYMPDC